MDDLDHLTTCHEALMKTGEGTTSFYRFLSKGQQWIWLQTRYYITYHQWNAKPEFVMATHKVMNYQDVLKDMKHELATTDQGVSGGERGGGGGGTESEIDSMEMKSRAESPTWSSRSSIGCSSGTSTRHSQDLGAKMNIEMYPLDMEKQHQVQFQHHQLFPPYKTEEDTEDNVSNSSRQDSANSFMPTSSVGTVAIPATAVTAVSTARAAAAVVPSSAAAAAAVVVAAGMSVASPASPLPVVGPVSNVVSAASPGQLPVLMSPVQMQLQAQLRMKHNELAKRMGKIKEKRMHKYFCIYLRKLTRTIPTSD